MLQDHPSRRRVVGEMHLRRWPELSAPCEVVQILRIVPDEIRHEEWSALSRWLSERPANEHSGKRHLSGVIGGGIPFTWERHTEASTVTLFFPEVCVQSVKTSNADSPDMIAALEWIEGLPGQILRATRLYVCSDVLAAKETVSKLKMEAPELVHCVVGTGVNIWSDFRIGPTGYGRIVFSSNGTSNSDLTRIIQRVQELGNYRNLALLGLPVAQDNWLILNTTEVALDELVEDLASDEVDDPKALGCVTELTVTLMKLANKSGFRMRATSAYARIVEDRLAEVAPVRIKGHQTLTDFTSRRLLPAIRTCSAHDTRLADLLNRAQLCAALLRTRIETRIELQNFQLLSSLDRSAKLQLALQKLVEGLSVFAISYYIIGIIHYIVPIFTVDKELRDIYLSIISVIVLIVSLISVNIVKKFRL